LNIKKDEKGFVLVLSFFILVAVLLLVASMTRILQSELKFYNYNKNQKKAFYAAEAGVAYGAEIFSDSDKIILVDNGGNSFYELKSYQELNSKFDEAEVEELTWNFIDSNTKIKFISRAAKSGITKTVNSTYLIYNNIFDSALASGDTIYVKNSHIISDGKIKSRNGIDGTIYVENDEEIEVITDSNFEIPKLDFEELRTMADNYINVDTISGDEIEYESLPDYDTTDGIEDINDTSEQFTYIDGNLNIGQSVNEINGSGVIVVDGKLSMGNNIEINQAAGHEDDYLIFLVRGSIDNEGVIADDEDTVEGKNAIKMQGLIYSEGNTIFGNQFEINGSVISGGDLTLKNSNSSEPNIRYDPKFIEKLFDWGISFPQEEDEIYNIYQITNWSES
jgi:hypothetical protein